jgi:type IV pilus assembly protein PilB
MLSQSSLLTVLKDSDFLSAAQSESIEQLYRQRNVPLAHAIAQQPDVDTFKLAQHCAAWFQLIQQPIEVASAIALITELDVDILVKRWFAIPIARQNNWLRLAVTDPTESEGVQAFQFATGMHIQRQICDIADASAVIDALNNQGLSEPSVPLYQPSADIRVPTEDDNQEQQEDNPYATPVGQYVHQIILHAVQQGASDIHFEPFEQHYRVRMRIDGLLTTTHSPHKTLNRRLSSRLKLLAQLNIAEKRLPQDGRIQLSIESQQKIDIRVSTLPTFWGEKVVLRLLGRGSHTSTLSHLGLTCSQHHCLQQALTSPQGLILVTGPTGSGKTTTLYAALQHLNHDQRNISTVEDPIEIQLSGINQVQANDAIGLDFSTVLRALLRQDPDTIMVGEIRDLATAQMAIRAAQTGHLVLSTLHTNSAHESLIRLQQMGIADYQLGASLKLIIAQRLVRKLCQHCKKQSDEQHPETQVADQWIANPKGCKHCLGGYRGRVGIYDFYQPVNSASNPQHIAQRESRGCQLWHQGIRLVEQGITSLAELSRVVDPGVTNASTDSASL